jgi:predicted metalloprotease with PDZ domain
MPSQALQSQWSKRFGKKRLWFERVIPGSPAEKAGLPPVDQLIAVEGIEIKEVKKSTMPFWKKAGETTSPSRSSGKE